MAQEVVEGPAIVSEDVPVADAVASSLDRDNASGHQWVGSLFNGVLPTLYPEVGWRHPQPIDDLVDAVLKCLSWHGWSKRRRE